MTSFPVLKLNAAIKPDTELLNNLVMMGFPKEISEKALIHSSNNTNLSVAIDWIQAQEREKTDSPVENNITSQEKAESIKETSPLPKPETSPLPKPETSPPLDQTSLAERTSKTASLVNYSAAPMVVESRITKKMEEGKRQWEKEQHKKEYERLQKEKIAKKEQEARLKSQLELDRKERAEKLGAQSIALKDKEQQELEFRQKEADKEKSRIQQQRLAERSEKERVMRLLQEDKIRRENLQNPSASIPPTLPSPTPSQVPKSIPPSTVPHSGDSCMIQIRLPHGNPLRQRFSGTDLLQDVHDYVASHLEPGLSFTFIIPMPRKEFNEEDMLKSLTELKLNGVTLTVLTETKRGLVKQAAVQPLHIPPPPFDLPMDYGPPHILPIVPPQVPPQETVADKIKKLPTYKFAPGPEPAEPVICLICQCEFIVNEEIKKLPCNHDYHVTCVDPWLIDNDSCPLCTQKIYK